MKLVVFVLTLFVSACSAAEHSSETKIHSERTATAVFAGGCFWCMEPPYDSLEGVIKTTSGYAGGDLIAPTYRDVTSGRSGHLEVVQVTYDPTVVSYVQLLEVFWRNVDPLDAGGQFCDRGESYETAIFTTTDREAMLAKQSKQTIEQKLGQDVVTPVRSLTSPGFYPAEAYHQDYYMKNPLRYKYYRASCGRDRRLNELWGD